MVLQTAHDELAAQAKQTKRFECKNQKLRCKNAVLRTKLINAIKSAKKIKASRVVARQECNTLNARIKVLGGSLARQAVEREFAEHGVPVSSANAVAVRLANTIW